MTREEAIDFGEMWLELQEDSKNSNTYKFFKTAMQALKQELDLKEKSSFDGMTKGEVVKTVFPDLGDYVRCGNILRFEPEDSKFIIAFGDDWWNAPYKGGTQHE